MQLSETDRHWVAGLLEGEGCFSLQVNVDRRYDPPREYPVARLQVSMGDRDVMTKLADLVGGPLREVKKKRSPDHSTMWKIDIVRQRDLKELLPQIHDLMGERRSEKIQLMREHLGC